MGASKSIDLPFLHRSCAIEERAIDENTRTVTLSFSSEAEVKRSFGQEILDHGPGSADLSRINDSAPLLVNHDWDDHVGVVENASIGGDRKGRAVVRFGSSTRAKEIFQDVKDGIRRKVSVGYWVNKMQPETREAGLETYRVTSWTPLEISIVSVPADTTVGVGRDGEKTRTATISGYQESTMSVAPNEIPVGQATAPPPINITEIRAEAAKAERARTTEIRAIATKFADRVPGIGELADKAISDGLELNEFRRQAFESVPGVTRITNPNPLLGVPDKDLAKYSFSRAIRGAGENSLGGLERELSDEMTKRMGKSPGSFWVPQDVLEFSKRDLLKGTASLGGNLVATEFLAESFIELLRNRMMVARLGATYLNGLVGDIAIPRQTGSGTAYWVTETQASTESDMTFDQVTLTPKCVTAVQDYSKKLLIQSTPSVEQLVRNDLALVLALAVDLAALHGTGSAQPTGIINTSGIGDVPLGTNGGLPTWATLVALETEVAIDNADVNAMAYVLNAKTRGVLKTTLKATVNSDYLWGEGAIGDGIGMLNGYRAAVTNQVAGNLTKGTSTTIASAIFFGNWADLLIGNWQGLDILVDPYTQALNRVYRVLASMYTDVAVRHPQSFAVAKDVLTA